MLILIGFSKNHQTDQCMVYENRPKACREYPHTDRKRFIQILNLSHKNCETCPVVYKVFESLKNL
jgi:Fe-S-cluster containining protein